MPSRTELGPSVSDNALVKSLIFDSFAVSQGGEMTQEYAFAVYSYLFPEVALRLHEQRYSGITIPSDNIAEHLTNFVNHLPHHDSNRDDGGIYIQPTWDALTMMRKAFEGVAWRPFTEEEGQDAGFWLGRYMLRRDEKFLSREHGRGRPEPTRYSLLESNFNSHLLHYAYLQNPERLGKYSLRHAAVFAGRLLCGALEKGDHEPLVIVDTKREELQRLFLILNTHLSHYPQHAEAIPAETLLDRVTDPEFLTLFPSLSDENA